MLGAEVVSTIIHKVEVLELVPQYQPRSTLRNRFTTYTPLKSSR
jgi:hypothetical protein